MPSPKRVNISIVRQVIETVIQVPLPVLLYLSLKSKQAGMPVSPEHGWTLIARAKSAMPAFIRVLSLRVQDVSDNSRKGITRKCLHTEISADRYLDRRTVLRQRIYMCEGIQEKRRELQNRSGEIFQNGLRD